MIGVGLPLGTAVAVNVVVKVRVALAVGVIVAVFVLVAVRVKVGVLVFVGVKVADAVGVFVLVKVFVGVRVFVIVGVAGERVITAPFNGAPVKFTAPVPLVPDRSAAFRIAVWKVPLALPVKLSTTR
jgi:hypothetical protein